MKKTSLFLIFLSLFFNNLISDPLAQKRGICCQHVVVSNFDESLGYSGKITKDGIAFDQIKESYLKTLTSKECWLASFGLKGPQTIEDCKEFCEDKNIISNHDINDFKALYNISKYCCLENPYDIDACFYKRLISVGLSINIIKKHFDTNFEMQNHATYYILTGGLLENDIEIKKLNQKEFDEWSKKEFERLIKNLIRLIKTEYSGIIQVLEEFDSKIADKNINKFLLN